MYCTKCGKSLMRTMPFAQIAERSRKLEHQWKKEQSRKRKGNRIIGILLLLVVVTVALFYSTRFQRELKKAEKYEESNELEMASVKYEQIIGKWPEKKETYYALSALYAEQKEYEKAIDILHRGEENVPEGTGFSDQLTQLESEKKEYDREQYARIYDDAIYENLLQSLDICFCGDYFENVEELDDLSIYYQFFYNFEYGWQSSPEEKFYNYSLQMYKIPAYELWDVLMKYLDFEGLDLAEHLNTDPSNGTDYYDVEEGMYYTRYFGGFGGPHDGYSKIEYETLEAGVIKATATFNVDGDLGEYYREKGSVPQTCIVVKETEKGLRLMSYTGNA